MADSEDEQHEPPDDERHDPAEDERPESRALDGEISSVPVRKSAIPRPEGRRPMRTLEFGERKRSTAPPPPARGRARKPTLPLSGQREPTPLPCPSDAGSERPRRLTQMPGATGVPAPGRYDAAGRGPAVRVMGGGRRSVEAVEQKQDAPAGQVAASAEAAPGERSAAVSLIPEVEPTLLLIGDSPLTNALMRELDDQGFYVETAEPAQAADLVVAAAPDLIVLLGPAGEDAALCRSLVGKQDQDRVPVALVTSSASLTSRFEILRRGVDLVVAVSAGVDGVAAQLAEAARAASTGDSQEQEAQPGGAVFETTYGELVEAVAVQVDAELRGAHGKPSHTLRLVMGSDRKLLAAVDALTGAIRDDVIDVETLEQEVGVPDADKPAAEPQRDLAAVDAVSDDEAAVPARSAEQSEQIEPAAGPVADPVEFDPSGATGALPPEPDLLEQRPSGDRVTASRPALLPPPSSPHIPAAGLRRVMTLGQVQVPLWVLLVSGALFAASAVALAVVYRSEPERAVHAEQSAGPESAKIVPPKQDPPPRTVEERARRGDETALKALSQKPEAQRNSAELLALAEGQLAQKSQQVEKAQEQLKRDPSLAKQRDVQKKLVRLSRDPGLGPAMLRVIAELPGPESADLLYEVWTGTPKRTATTRLAEALLYSAPVSEKASPALAVALALRREKDCTKARVWLERALREGDRRATRALAMMTRQRGCGPRKRSDCYGCLRKDDLLLRAMQAVRTRPGPKL